MVNRGDLKLDSRLLCPVLEAVLCNTPLLAVTAPDDPLRCLGGLVGESSARLEFNDVVLDLVFSPAGEVRPEFRGDPRLGRIACGELRRPIVGPRPVGVVGGDLTEVDEGFLCSVLRRSSPLRLLIPFLLICSFGDPFPFPCLVLGTVSSLLLRLGPGTVGPGPF